MIRGADQLVEMRRNGRRPGSVTLSVGPHDGGMASSWRQNDPGKGYLHARHDTPLSGADLRCVVGIPVFVFGDPGLWALSARYGELCVEAGAAFVVAMATDEAGEFHVADSRKGQL